MSERPGLTLYGIPNCDQVRKARAWLAENRIDYLFHDFKKAAPTPALIERWLTATDWESLLNRKGSTWRGLPDAQKAQTVDAEHAKALMQAAPSVIRRPLLEHGATLLVGFDAARYHALLQPSSPPSPLPSPSSHE